MKISYSELVELVGRGLRDKVHTFSDGEWHISGYSLNEISTARNGSGSIGDVYPCFINWFHAHAHTLKEPEFRTYLVTLKELKNQPT